MHSEFEGPVQALHRPSQPAQDPSMERKARSGEHSEH